MSLPNPLKPPKERNDKNMIGSMPIENLVLSRANGEIRNNKLPNDIRNVNGVSPKFNKYDLEDNISYNSSHKIYEESNPFNIKDKKSSSTSNLPDIYHSPTNQFYPESRLLISSSSKVLLI